ncbi:NAD(P)-binding domain-containing protein [Rasiella sp. SM2506]|uniref:NAD(P)-binding domain-containing protein n=1 Tax=Rasiella sp. SM2506 TaxID=3423914 RepID=UPI003D7B05B7
MTSSKIDTVIIGAGHAGLCMSYTLQQENRTHVVLEKHVTLYQWKNHRWDSFKLNTPLKYSRISGQNDGQPDDRNSIPLSENIAMWEHTIQQHSFPIKEYCDVTAVVKNADGTFLVQFKENGNVESSYRARNVIAACGFYQNIKIPNFSKNLPSTILQLDVKSYKNPDQTKGSVLVVGSGQSGIQIAEELAVSGKNVYLATSAVGGTIRSYRGEDAFFWMDRIRMLTMPTTSLPTEEMRYNKNAFTGNDHPISYYSLYKLGVNLTGGLTYINTNGDDLFFKNNLQENIAVAQQKYDLLLEKIEAWIQNENKHNYYLPPTQELEWVPNTQLLAYEPPTILHLKECDIQTVIWTTGWTADFSWIKIPSILADLGATHLPKTCVTKIPGFFWLGFPWLRTLSSANVGGFDEDAKAIANLLL